jgi:hypothetical protein
MANLPQVPAGLSSIALGLNGCDIITDTTECPNGDWFCIVPITATVFAHLVPKSGHPVTVNRSASVDVTALSVPAGIPIYGRFTTITLTSGQVIAYRA